MNNQKLLLLALVAIASISAITTLAYADSGDGTQTGIELGISIAVTGGVSGAVLSIVRVVGKSIKDKPEKIDTGKFFTNLIVGAVIGFVLVQIGMNSEDLKGNPDVVALAAISSNFMFLYIFNESIRPMFAGWISNLRAVGKNKTTTKPPGM